MSTPTMTVPQGIRLSGRRMTIVTAALLFALLGYSVPSNMLVPLLTSLEASCHISAVAAIWISLIALLSGAAFVPTLCRLGDTTGWKKSLVNVGLTCLAVGALIAALSSSLPLPSIQAFEGFWGLAAGLTLLAAVFAAVYLVTDWSRVPRRRPGHGRPAAHGGRRRRDSRRRHRGRGQLSRPTQPLLRKGSARVPQPPRA